MITLPDDSLENWLAELKPHQRQIIEDLLKTNSPLEAARIYLSAQGAANTAPFGGVGAGNDHSFFNFFMGELEKFLCGDDAYEEDRKKLTAHGPMTKSVLTHSIAAILGHALGVVPALLSAPLVLVLAVIGHMGSNAWCQSRKASQQIPNQSSPANSSESLPPSNS